MATALMSLVTGRAVRDDVAMTGELTLTGQVLPIGGLKEKALAAQRAGVKRVLAPVRNEPDAEDFPDALRENLRGNLERGMQSLGKLVPPGVDPNDTSRETGRKRAREGVPLEAVLHAYRLGGQVIWEGLLSTSRDRFRGRYDRELLAVSGWVWRVIDASSAALVDAYRLEESRLRSQELSKRHAFLNALLDGRGKDTTVAQEAATVLGLPTCGPTMTPKRR